MLYLLGICRGGQSVYSRWLAGMDSAAQGAWMVSLRAGQVEVARLTLELKEAEMQRDDAESKKASEQQTVNSLQVATRLA